MTWSWLRWGVSKGKRNGADSDTAGRETNFLRKQQRPGDLVTLRIVISSPISMMNE